MAQRIQFRNNISREFFFKTVLKSLNFRQWKELFTFLKIRRTVFDKYRSGYLTIPFEVYNKLIASLTSKQLKSFSSIVFLDSNWGRAKGGRITYSRYKSVFEAGRRKGIEKFKKKSHNFDFYLPLTKELAYFTGLFIGDGFTNKYGRYYLTQFVGHKCEEHFYKNFVSSYSSLLFDLNPIIKDDRLANAIRVNFYSKSLFLLLTKRFAIKPGRKSADVLIPKEIVSSDTDILLSCISGIYDAECCVFWDTRSIYNSSYPRIDLHMCNPKLIKQISFIFNKEGILHSISGDYERILVYGNSNIKSFLKRVKLYNPKHLNKLSSLM